MKQTRKLVELLCQKIKKKIFYLMLTKNVITTMQDKSFEMFLSKMNNNCKLY